MRNIIVVGGGASGLTAAIYASFLNNVILIERNSTCGKKLLLTGNGRCNYWNSDQDLSHYHSDCSIDHIINEKNEKEIMSFFKRLGIVPNIVGTLYYPYSNQAVSIKNALVKEALVRGVKIINDEYVDKVVKEDNKFTVVTDKNIYTADNVIIATGSKSYPKTGSDGNGYKLLEAMGHKINSVLPGLVQIITAEGYVKKLSGVRVSGIVKYENVSYPGEIMFTDYGLSGICIMQISGIISKALNANKIAKISINFTPWLNSTEEFITFFNHQISTTYKRSIQDIMDGFLNYKLGNMILTLAHIDGMKDANSLNEREITNLAELIINHSFNVTSTKSFDTAQICLGGLSINDVTNSLESKIVSGLFITGELLDVHGDCGGYNLSLAWITGMMVGSYLRGKND